MAQLDFDHIRELLQKQKHKALEKIEPKIIDHYKLEVLSYVIRRPYMEIMTCSVYLNLLYALYQDKEKDPSDPLPNYLIGILWKCMEKDKVIQIMDHTKLQQNDVILYYHKDKLIKAIIQKVIDGPKVLVKLFVNLFDNKYTCITLDSNSFIIGARIIVYTPHYNRKPLPKQIFFFYNI